MRAEPNGLLSMTAPFALQDLASFKPEIMQILSLNHMGDTLKTTIQTKQDLYTNSYKITINWGTIQVLENVFYTKVSRIRRLTKTHIVCIKDPSSATTMLLCTTMTSPFMTITRLEALSISLSSDSSGF